MKSVIIKPVRTLSLVLTVLTMCFAVNAYAGNNAPNAVAKSHFDSEGRYVVDSCVNPNTKAPGNGIFWRLQNSQSVWLQTNGQVRYTIGRTADDGKRTQSYLDKKVGSLYCRGYKSNISGS